MLKHTFIHIPKVGRVTERKIWEAGVLTWEDAASRGAPGVPSQLLDHFLQLSFYALERGNVRFFLEMLPSAEIWRLLVNPSMQLSICYLDIETTGLRPDVSELTVAGLYDGVELKYFISGQNLEELYEEIRRYDLIVTFNGKSFDVPFLKASLPGIEVPEAHIDLRYLLKQVGLAGGLKAIERTTGMARMQDELSLLDGYDAVTLWQLHKRGVEDALPTLLRYNAEDVVSLKPLLELACRMHIEQMQTGFALPEVSERAVPEMPYSIELIRRLREGRS
ncbi:MAG: ribonuclease H-like domain-containing protein [Candidatus Bathyarchaeia archaeon]